MACTHDGKHLIANLIDDFIHILDFGDLTVKSILEGKFYTPAFIDLRVSSDNRWLVGQRNPSILVWDLYNGKLLGDLRENGFYYGIGATQYSSDGILLVGTDIGVWAFEVPSLKEIYHITENLSQLNDISIDEMSKFAVTGSIDGKILVWNYISGSIIAKINTDNPIEFCALAPTSPKRIIAGHADTVHVLELMEAKKPKEY